MTKTTKSLNHRAEESGVASFNESGLALLQQDLQ